MADGPPCSCHGEPMTRSGRDRHGNQKFQCAVKKREAARRVHAANPEVKRGRARCWYSDNREKKLAYERERYEANPLPKRQRDLLAYHRRRLVELHEAVTKGSPSV